MKQITKEVVIVISKDNDLIGIVRMDENHHRLFYKVQEADDEFIQEILESV